MKSNCQSVAEGQESEKHISARKVSIILGWLVTPFYVVTFVSILCFFQVIHYLAGFFGQKCHERTLSWMNLAIISAIRFIGGASVKLVGAKNVPNGRPVILVSNHQSMYDIPMIMWALRRREVGFVAKRELGKFVPGISISLRKLYSVLIDRKEPAQSISAIRAWGEVCEKLNRVAAVFPEGTRARDGIMKKFKGGGFSALVRSMPTAVIQPVAITGNWEFLRYGFKPVPFGVKISVEFLQPFEQQGREPSDLLSEAEQRIREKAGPAR